MNGWALLLFAFGAIAIGVWLGLRYPRRRGFPVPTTLRLHETDQPRQTRNETGAITGK